VRGIYFGQLLRESNEKKIVLKELRVEKLAVILEMTNARIKTKWVKRQEKLFVISIKVMFKERDDLLTHCKRIIKQIGTYYL